jgi:hypothetical protein
MSNEIFRYVNLRGPRLAAPDGNAQGTPVLAGEPSPLVQQLIRLRIEGRPREEYERVARDYIASDAYAMRSPLMPDLAALARWLADQGDGLGAAAFDEGVRSTLGASVEDLRAQDAYRVARARVGDSVLALSVAPDSLADKTALSRALRVAGLIDTYPAWPAAGIGRDHLAEAPILLPPAIFPLPPRVNPHDAAAAEAAKARQEQLEQARRTEAELARQIEQGRQAIADLHKALRADTYELRKLASVPARRPAPAKGPAASDDAASAAHGEGPRAIVRPEAPALAAGVLSPKAVESLGGSTLEVLKRHGVATDFVDVPYAVQAVEASTAAASARLFSGKPSRTVTRIGNRWLPGHGHGHAIDIDGSAGPWRTPGPCAMPEGDAPGGDVTVPATTASAIRPIGIAELLLVRQQIKRYLPGEVAHIENVMRGETRHRTHRDTTRVTETVMMETELAKEESRDLQTTDRFELQQESETVLKEESSRSIAVSISASYGPFASGTANINSTHGDSKETSTKNATQFAREVTDKAVKKVEQRVLERRTVTTEREVQEISRHGFDNREGMSHIQGIYRWVDKVYSAQVVSYGMRLMFELVVPEPSAFYRFAMGAAPAEGLSLERPDPPGYCQHPSGTFTPLTPADLHEGNYQFWVSKYGATGVEPPPPLHRTIGIAMTEEPAPGDTIIMTGNSELQVPQGYRAERVWVGGEQALYRTTPPDAKEFMSFHVGRAAIGIGVSGPMHGEDGVIPVVGHGYSVAGYGVTIEVLCTRTPEALAAWQMATFTSILNAYNDLKGQYEAALTRAELAAQQGAGMLGRNPVVNRDIERRELKRAALSLFTGQHFDDFDAMRRGVPPHGYPQMDLADAAAEGDYIRFYEQALEWGNMSYRFYPYFWARKSEWPRYLAQDDTDPLFGQFLQAGAARIQVPVQPGFERAVVYLLETGNAPWKEDDNAFNIQGSLYRSMVDEIRDEQLGSFTKGPGTLSVQQGQAIVNGTGTAFDAQLHFDRDIMIAHRTYRVAQVVSPTSLLLDRPFRDPSATALPYSFGGRLVGDPWDVKVPTTLVHLQDGDDLPDFTDN